MRIRFTSDVVPFSRSIQRAPAGRSRRVYNLVLGRLLRAEVAHRGSGTGVIARSPILRRGLTRSREAYPGAVVYRLIRPRVII
jgi:hypothetical protein